MVSKGFAFTGVAFILLITSLVFLNYYILFYKGLGDTQANLIVVDSLHSKSIDQARSTAFTVGANAFADALQDAAASALSQGKPSFGSGCNVGIIHYSGTNYMSGPGWTNVTRTEGCCLNNYTRLGPGSCSVTPAVTATAPMGRAVVERACFNLTNGGVIQNYVTDYVNRSIRDFGALVGGTGTLGGINVTILTSDYAPGKPSCAIDVLLRVNYTFTIPGRMALQSVFSTTKTLYVQNTSPITIDNYDELIDGPGRTQSATQTCTLCHTDCRGYEFETGSLNEDPWKCCYTRTISDVDAACGQYQLRVDPSYKCTAATNPKYNKPGFAGGTGNCKVSYNVTHYYTNQTRAFREYAKILVSDYPNEDFGDRIGQRFHIDTYVSTIENLYITDTSLRPPNCSDIDTGATSDLLRPPSVVTMDVQPNNSAVCYSSQIGTSTSQVSHYICCQNDSSRGADGYCATDTAHYAEAAANPVSPFRLHNTTYFPISARTDQWNVCTNGAASTCINHTLYCNNMTASIVG